MEADMKDAQSIAIDIGIPEKERQDTVLHLSKLLADTYTLYLKTHNFHWNVTGPMFQTLHLMFETQYTELSAAVDEIAERIRALGSLAPASYAQFGKLTSIQESDGNLKDVEMINDLVKSQETVIKTARGVLPSAEKSSDQATIDLVTRRLHIHEKTAWMLRSLLGKN
jgi:starvation-inducible DNA-binding protein